MPSHREGLGAEERVTLRRYHGGSWCLASDPGPATAHHYGADWYEFMEFIAPASLVEDLRSSLEGAEAERDMLGVQARDCLKLLEAAEARAEMAVEALREITVMNVLSVPDASTVLSEKMRRRARRALAALDGEPEDEPDEELVEWFKEALDPSTKTGALPSHPEEPK